MRIKTLLIALTAGAFAFASCEKPEVEPTPVPTPDPVLAEVTTTIDGQSVKISGTVKDFTFESAEKTPVGVWSSLEDGKKAETAGTYNAEKKAIEGTIEGLEYEKAYTVGTFVSVEGKKFYSKGASVTIKEPVTPVKFSGVAATADKNSIKVSGKAEDFKFIDNDKTSVGIWYSTDAGKTKTEVKGSFNAETSMIEGTATELAYTTYTAGIWAVEDGEKQFSEGVEVVLVAPATPVKFSEVTATAQEKNVTVSGKTADFTYVDEATTPVGIWYALEGQAGKSKVAGTFDAETSTINGTVENLDFGTYTFGVYAKEDGEEQFSEGVTVTIEQEVVNITFEGITADFEGTELYISGSIHDFPYVDNQSTPAGVWYSTDGGSTMIEKIGLYMPPLHACQGSFPDMAPGTYLVGLFAEVNGDRYFSAGIEVTLAQATPVIFSEVSKSIDGQNVTVSATTADFTYIDEFDTPVGVWYTAEGSTEKMLLTGTFDSANNKISGTIENLPYGVYTVGVYANEDGIEQYSEGIEVRLVEPATFSEVTAKAEGRKITVTGKVAAFNFVDMETTAVGLWYINAEGARKEVKGSFDSVTSTVTATTPDFAVGDYTVGIFVRKDGVKFFSEGVAVSIAANPGFHIPDFGNGTEF